MCKLCHKYVTLKRASVIILLGQMKHDIFTDSYELFKKSDQFKMMRSRRGSGENTLIRSWPHDVEEFWCSWPHIVDELRCSWPHTVDELQCSWPHTVDELQCSWPHNVEGLVPLKPVPYSCCLPWRDQRMKGYFYSSSAVIYRPGVVLVGVRIAELPIIFHLKYKHLFGCLEG